MNETVFFKGAKLGLAGVIGFVGVFFVSRLAVFVPSPAPPGQPTAYDLMSVTGGQPVTFEVQPATDTPKQLEALPPGAEVRLVAAVDADKGTPASAGQLASAPWLLPPYARVRAITQFDHGPLMGSNCTMASGAMLARLVAGIVTSGSALRALQGDQEGGTSLLDLQHAVGKFGLSFNRAALTPTELREISYAGAGAVIQGIYGRLGSWRLQSNFFGGHAIYVDGFRPAAAGHPDQYYVIDPIGVRKYGGEWLPADDVEAFGTALGNGRIYTAWGYPGGQTPTSYPILPPRNRGSGGSPSTQPGKSGEPSTAPSASIGTTFPPLPANDPNAESTTVGEVPPEIPPETDDSDGPIVSDKYHLVGSASVCVSSPVPRYCPLGIDAFLPPGATPVPIPSGLVDELELLYAQPVGPGVMQVIFALPDDAAPSLVYWDESAPAGGPLLVAQSVDRAIFGNRLVAVATFPIEPGHSYNFLGSAASGNVQAISAVGTTSR